MDKITEEQRSKNMSEIRSKNTKPELLLRGYLFKKGFRYRVHYKTKGRPDIAFPKEKIAIFVQGCFWHNHGCKYSVIPKSNKDYWIPKLKKNTRRDREVKSFLEKKGWRVIYVWECDLKKGTVKTLEKLEQSLNKKIRKAK